MTNKEKMEKRLNRMQKYSISVLVIISVISIGDTLWEKIHVPKQLDQHFISRYNERIEKVKPFIDEGTIVGYVTDKIFGSTGSNREHKLKYMVTRYCLAPILVADSINYKIVIGDFHKPFQFNDLIVKNLRINRSLGNGLLILENTIYDN